MNERKNMFNVEKKKEATKMEIKKRNQERRKVNGD